MADLALFTLGSNGCEQVLAVRSVADDPPKLSAVPGMLGPAQLPGTGRPPSIAMTVVEAKIG